MILNQGINQLTTDVGDDLSQGEAGTATTLFQKSQTGVINAIADSGTALIDKTISKEAVNVTYLAGTTLANEHSITEYEVNNVTIAYNRIVKPGLTKTSNDEFTILHKFEFVIVV